MAEAAAQVVLKVQVPEHGHRQHAIVIVCFHTKDHRVHNLLCRPYS
jgi:hypothetical protein